MSQIIKGFKALNDMNVLHRDLKLANILVHFKNIDEDTVFNDWMKVDKIKKEGNLIGNVNVVIADLGFAKELEDNKKLMAAGEGDSSGGSESEPSEDNLPIEEVAKVVPIVDKKQ